MRGVVVFIDVFFFFFKQKTAYEMRISDWSSDVCSSDLFGGKYFCHDVRVIRLPRHGASLPIGLGVSCSADRQILGKITRDGVFLEQLETDPAKYQIGRASCRERVCQYV